MKPIHILLIEDNDGDILLTLEALEEFKIMNKVTVIKDGKKAIDFFETSPAKESIPDMILLDINLPKKSGSEVLHYIKTSNAYKQIPIIMLTTSSSEADITQSYKNYANCYITKPIDVTDFMKAVAKIEEFWINIVTMPKN